MPKRYFNVNTKHFELPQEFVNSRGPKTIHFIHCRLEYNNQLVGNASIHADWVVRLPTMDHFVSWCNTDISKRFKWEITHDITSVNIWFKENAVNDITIPDETFVLQLMLEF